MEDGIAAWGRLLHDGGANAAALSTAELLSGASWRRPQQVPGAHPIPGSGKVGADLLDTLDAMTESYRRLDRQRALAGYLWGNPHARIALWPELPMDGWRGTPAAIHNRLVAMLGWTEPYYKDVASLLLRLALNAPGEDGPIRSSSALMVRMDPEVLVRLYEHDPDRRREAESLVGRDQARAVKGAVGRFANFFDAAEQGWSFETSTSPTSARPT